MSPETAVVEKQIKVTEEIRALLNLLVQQHVRSWYTTLSQDEQLFVEFGNLSSHVQTTLSARVQAVDWQAYLLFTLPELVLRHLEDFNIASDRSRNDVDLDLAFLVLQSHPGIVEEESYLMHVADGLLVVLLPEHDLMSEVAYTITREALSDLVLRTVMDRLSEPWFWDELLLKLCRETQVNIAQEKANVVERAGRLLSSVWHNLTNNLTGQNVGKYSERKRAHQQSWFERLRNPLQTLRTFTKEVQLRTSFYDTALPAILREFMRPFQWPTLRAICCSVVLPLADILFGQEIMHQLEKYTQAAVSYNNLARMVRLARHVLFPNDQPSQARIIPSRAQQKALRAELNEVLPSGIDIPFLQSKVINRVLLFRVLDSLLGTIFPELQRRSPEQLKEKLVRIRQANVEAAGSGGIRTGDSQSRPASIHSPASLSMTIERSI